MDIRGFLFVGERLGQPFPGGGRRNISGEVRGYRPLPDQELGKRPERGEMPPDCHVGFFLPPETPQMLQHRFPAPSGRRRHPVFLAP